MSEPTSVDGAGETPNPLWRWLAPDVPPVAPGLWQYARRPAVWVPVFVLALPPVITGLWRYAAQPAVGVPVLVLAVALGAVALVPLPAAPRARGLPGYDGPRHDLTVLRRWGRAVAACLVAVATVGLAVQEAGFALLFLSLAVLAASADVVGWVDDGLRLRRAIGAYGPTVALAYAGRSGGPWQLAMWEPYVLRSGQRCIVINRHEKYSDMIWDGAGLSCPLVDLGAIGFSNLRFVVVRSIRAMFYVQNAQSNAHYLALGGIVHVWLNHGDSDKPANFNERHADYDLLVVAGQAGIDRYAQNGIAVRPEQFVVLGRPQIRGIEPPRPGRVTDQRVLYAPTWAGIDPSVNFSSLRLGPQIVDRMLARGLTVVFRPHPLSRRGRRHGALIATIEQTLERDRAATGREHVWGERAGVEWSVVDCANHADLLVSDISSVVGDFLPSGKPYAMTMMQDDDPERFRTQHALARGAYLLRADLTNLDEVLDAMCGDDPMAADRAAVRRHVLTDRTGDEAADDFAAFVRTLATNHPGD